MPWGSAPGGIMLDVRLTPRGGRDAIEGVGRRADGRIVLKALGRDAALRCSLETPERAGR
jgi:uncharacterized protein